jgi:hypothetical protein
MTNEKCWSMDGERFDYKSVNELINSNNELSIGDIVFVGDAVTQDPTKWLVVDDILEQLQEQMQERAMDACGESAGDYPNLSESARYELQEFLGTWSRKYCVPSFYAVENASEYTLTAEDIE